MEFLIRKATLSDLDSIYPLFNKYRLFYGKSDNLRLSKKFISDRLENDESIVIVAQCSHNNTVGFVQLYPTFSSLSVKKVLILNDLYVKGEYRNQGVGELLMNFARKYAIEIGAISLSLETSIENKVAQYLYEKLGYINDKKTLHYQLTI